MYYSVRKWTISFDQTRIPYNEKDEGHGFRYHKRKKRNLQKLLETPLGTPMANRTPIEGTGILNSIH